jgi:hypothetical protein
MTDETIKVRFYLSALTREVCEVVREVAPDTTDDMLDEMLGQVYEDTDGPEYNSDPTYWEKGQCRWERVAPPKPPTKRYAVEVREVHVATYFVEAASEDEAVEITHQGLGERNPDMTEFSHTMDSDHTTVNESTEMAREYIDLTDPNVKEG